MANESWLWAVGKGGVVGGYESLPSLVQEAAESFQRKSTLDERASSILFALLRLTVLIILI